MHQPAGLGPQSEGWRSNRDLITSPFSSRFGRQDAALYGRRDACRYHTSRSGLVVDFFHSQLLEVEVRQLVQVPLFFCRQFGRPRTIRRDSSSGVQSDNTLMVPWSPSTRMTWPVRMICVASGTLTTAGKPYSRAMTLP
jgi:hypothetical protein